ncbi:hypothetical protein O3M35_000207 [Rhynocoris fuscipes]|uniref:Protein artemis n=1 Tax=Rhynocoris fuscipes TaxID=488301 RepID=A0AAW1DSB8_9HEMI
MEEYKGILLEKGFEFCRIDYFHDLEGAEAFFLSHFHRDHMKGISSPDFHKVFKEKKGVFLYCSEITKRFIERDPEIDIPRERLYVLDREGIYITKNKVCIKVTAMRAGHCPGSLMFLFESYGGRVLFTGDFRLTLDDLKKTKALHKNDKVIKLNNIYLDTTFANPLYTTFPDRQKSLEIIKSIIMRSKAMQNITYTVILPPASVGIEYLMIELAELFKTYIHVSDYSYRRFHSFIQPLENIVTTELSSSNIHFCTFKSKDCDTCPLKMDKYVVLKIKPSAMFFDDFTYDDNQGYTESKSLDYRVAYSSHCSLCELNEFVTYLKPEKISPLVPSKEYSKDKIIDMVLNWHIKDDEVVT